MDNNIFEELDCKKFKSFSSAWSEVISLYDESVNNISRAFKMFIEEIKSLTETSTPEETQKVIKALKGKFKSNEYPRCTYPIIGISPKNDLTGSSHKWENKILIANNEYWATITKPTDPVIKNYYDEEFSSLALAYKEQYKNDSLVFFVGRSSLEIPLSFAIDIDGKDFGELNNSHLRRIVPTFFQMPDLSLISDAILDKNLKKFRSSFEEILKSTFGKNLVKEKVVFNTSWWNGTKKALHPLTFFGALRTDSSLNRLKHYTHTNPSYFQPYILFTNYEKYVNAFISHHIKVLIKEGGEIIIPSSSGNDVSIKSDNYKEICQPDAEPETWKIKSEFFDRSAQMPAFHYIGKDKRGVTLINIGVGPSNAKTITDHLAVLRPYCWLMVGHCGGLRYRQQLGQFVLAESYVRDDKVLEDVLPKWVPIPPVLGVQEEIEKAAYNVLRNNYNDSNENEGESRFNDYYESKVRIGVVYTTADRNWEFQPNENLFENLELSRAIAIEMESATIAGNGYRYRIPYGTLLCVSDRPLHGEIKMRNMADEFYLRSTKEHLEIALETIKSLRNNGSGKEKIKNMKRLRGADDPIFR